MNEPAIIHTDGACSGNPGPGGYAAIIEVSEYRMTVTGGDPNTTNNRMELSAVIEALRLINSQSDLQHSHVTIRSDSQYIVNAFNDKWIDNWQKKGWRTAKKQPVANRDLWEAFLKEIGPHMATFVWVKGHSGDPMNERCDTLAVEQAKIAPSQPAYWVSLGTPLTTVQVAREPEDAEHADTQKLELILERNDMALMALRKSVNLQIQEHRMQAADQLRTALRHLEEQKRILASDGRQNPGRPMDHIHPISLGLASYQNAKALQVIQRCLTIIDELHNPEVAMNETTATVSLIKEQHQIITNAAKDIPLSPTNPQPDTGKLLDQTANAIRNALDDLRQGKSWKTADRLETSLQQLDNHRRLHASQEDDLPF